jgi:hypothetical protein
MYRIFFKVPVLKDNEDLPSPLYTILTLRDQALSLLSPVNFQFLGPILDIPVSIHICLYFVQYLFSAIFDKIRTSGLKLFLSSALGR